MTSSGSKTSITQQQYLTLDTAYTFYNKALFNNKLPSCMIVLQRKGKNNLGYFHAERFVERSKDKKKDKKNTVSELSLNPDNFIWQTDTAILSTLVHEMVHVWQFYIMGKQPKNGYHDKTWGREMERIGLMPSKTGKEGGKRTGQQMHHYIIQDGLFEKNTKKFLVNKSIKWTSFPLPSAVQQKKNKCKFCCPSCGANAWGKPELNINCGDCDERMEEV